MRQPDPPPPDEVARLLAEHADRYPEKATIGPLGGLTIPILLANPREGSPAFANAVAFAIGLRPNADPMGEQLAKECVLWPPRATWKAWRARFPAIDARLVRGLRRKLGIDALIEDDSPPEGGSPSGETRWCRLQLYGAPEPVRLSIEPPIEEAWRMYIEAATKPDGDILALTRAVVDSSVRGWTTPLDDLLERWPGLVVQLAKAVAELAGVDAEVQLGNW